MMLLVDAPALEQLRTQMRGAVIGAAESSTKGRIELPAVVKQILPF